MKKILALVLLVPSIVLATCTETTPNSNTTQVVCSGQAEAAPSAATDGRSIASAKGVSFFITSSANMTSNGTFAVWFYSPTSGTWSRNYDLTITVPATTTAFTVQGFQVTVPEGRIDIRSVDAGAVTTTALIVTR